MQSSSSISQEKHIEFFEKHGYLLLGDNGLAELCQKQLQVNDLFPAGERKKPLRGVNKYKRRADHLVDINISEHVTLLKTYIATFKDIIQQKIGNEFYIVSFNYINSRIGSLQQGLHMDEIYNQGGLNIFCFVTDITREMGPTRLIPSSHQWSALHKISLSLWDHGFSAIRNIRMLIKLFLARKVSKLNGGELFNRIFNPKIKREPGFFYFIFFILYAPLLFALSVVGITYGLFFEKKQGMSLGRWLASWFVSPANKYATGKQGDFFLYDPTIMHNGGANVDPTRTRVLVQLELRKAIADDIGALRSVHCHDRLKNRCFHLNGFDNEIDALVDDHQQKQAVL